MMRARLTSEQVAAIAVSIVCIVTVAAVLTLTWDDSPDGTRSLSVETSGHGTVSYEDSYPFGTVADVWITPDDGYVIYGITVDGEPVGLTNNLNVFMDRDRDIFIDFREASSDDVEVEVDVSITEVMGIIVTGGIGDVSKTYEWGTLTPGGTISVVPGTSVTFTLTLADGYRFVDMRINGNEVPPSETFVVGDITADMSIELWLMKTDVDPGMYVIHAEHNGHGSVTPSDCEVAAGGSVTLTVSPNDGYMVSSVLVNYSEVELSDGKLVLSDIDGNKVVSVTFEEIEYTETVTVSVGDNGTVSPSGSVVVERGEDLELTITPDDGYRIASVILDGTDVTSEVKDSVFILSNVVSGHSVRVEFEVITYTVTVTAGENGSADPTTSVVEYGKSLKIVFIPEPGYRTSYLTINGGDRIVPDDRTNYVIDDIIEDKAVEVFFERDDSAYASVSVAIVGHGTVNDNSDSFKDEVLKGNSYTITSVPSEGYRLSKVLVDNVEVPTSGGVYVLNNIARDTAVEVVFEILMFTVTVNVGEHGSCDQQTQAVEYGSDLTFTFTPDSRYAVHSVTVDGVPVEIVDGTYVLRDIRADHVVAVTFWKVEFDIEISAGENGSASPSGIQRVQENESLTVVFTPSEGYTYDSVLVDGEEGTLTNGTYVFSNVLADHEISVTFKRIVITVSIDPTEGGSVEASSEAPYYYGDPLTLTFTPDVWYGLKSVTVNGVDVTAQLTDSKYVFSALTEDQAVSAVFEKYTVVDRIEVEGPSKTVYASSENTLDTSGLTVTAYYTDGSSRVVTDYELSPTDLTGKSGVVTVTVRYSESYSNTDKTVEASFSVKKASGEFTAYVTEYNGAAVNERLSQYVFDLKGLEPGGDAITFKVKVSDETGLSGVDFNACVWVQNLQDSSKNCALSKNIILTAESGGNRLFSGDLYGIADGSGLQTDVGSVPAGGMEITFTLRMSSSAGSDTMNQSLSFNLGVYAYDVEGQ
ncbi:InlB B-repeat-containing protein [Methanomethylophilus alvi]|uniref:InlB B-repeat-containing protein n=1 Tax=Methanomethylophilus alvi TaxID=1291540 RepID=UPI0037DD4958